MTQLPCIHINIGLPVTGSSTRDVSFTQSMRNVFEPIDITVTSDSCGITGSVSRSVIRGMVVPVIIGIKVHYCTIM